VRNPRPVAGGVGSTVNCLGGSDYNVWNEHENLGTDRARGTIGLGVSGSVVSVW